VGASVRCEARQAPDGCRHPHQIPRDRVAGPRDHGIEENGAAPTRFRRIRARLRLFWKKKKPPPPPPPPTPGNAAADDRIFVLIHPAAWRPGARGPRTGQLPEDLPRLFDGQPAGNLNCETASSTNMTMYWLTGTGASAAR